MNIISSYPSWYFLFCVGFALVLSFLLYRRDKKLAEFSKVTKGVLFGLRFICVAFISALLLSPLVSYLSRSVEKPILIIAQDNSASVLLAKDSSWVKNELQNKINLIKEELNADFEVDHFIFSDFLLDSDAPNYQGKLTEYDVIFENFEQKYANRNVGALLLISDGIYNQGNSPVYSIQNIEYPIFTVPLGDTTKFVDVKLNGLKTNKLAFLGNQFPVKVDVKTQRFRDEGLQYKVIQNGKVIYSSQLDNVLSDGTRTVSFNLKASAIGKQKYTIAVEPVEGERNTLNNSIDFYIDVLDGRQKVLLLGFAPHPDLGALKSAISANENYELETKLYSDFEGKISSYDLVILHHTTNQGLVSMDIKLKNILATETPLMLFGGGWKNVELLQNISVNGGGRRIVNKVQAKVNESFSLFAINDDIRKMVTFPPLATESGQRTKANGNKTLFTQKIGNVETEYPLLSFYDVQDKKVGRFSAEGIWRWKIACFQEFGSHDVFKRFIGRVIQYMALKSDRSFFRVNALDEIYDNEQLFFTAQIFNPSYEPINDPEVAVVVKNEQGDEFDFSMNRVGDSYQLSIANLDAGEYTYAAKTKYQGKSLSSFGSFMIKELQLEALDTEANHEILAQLSKRTNGKVIFPDDLSKFVNEVENREDISSVAYVSEEVEDIINLKWIFFVLLGLLSLEWFIRKRGGAY